MDVLIFSFKAQKFSLIKSSVGLLKTQWLNTENFTTYKLSLTLLHSLTIQTC